MKIQLFVIVVLLSMTSILSAQNNESYKTFKMESIYLKGNKFVKNGVEYPLGFFGSNLGREMKISPNATAEWDSHVKFRNLSLITSLTGLALVVASLSVEDRNTATGLGLVGFGLTIVSIPLSLKANNQLNKSIWTHNRDLFQY